MGLWEIRLANQEPIRVEVEDHRNLPEEYGEFASAHEANRWRFWDKPSPYWQVTDQVVVHKDIIVGVLPRRVKQPKPSIGFTNA